MKYIKYITFALTLLTLVSCVRDEFNFEGPALSFYPTVVQTAAEEDGNTYVLSLETSGFIDGSATATITVKMTSEGVISTVPPMEGNRITLEFNNTNQASILVTVENDEVPDDYTAEFRITGVSGELAGIGTDRFSLFVQDEDVVTLFGEDFNDCSNLNTFTGYSVTGAQVWSCTNFGLGSTAARMSGFSGGVQDNEDWLISPAYDLSSLDIGSVRFVSDRAFTGPELEFLVSTDYDGEGDPTAATWDVLDASYDTQNGNDTWASSGNINIEDYLTANTYFAFRYVSTVADGAATWTIDNFEVNSFHPNASGGGNDNLVDLPFADDFEDCMTDFSTPANWDAKNLTSKTDRNFSCRPTGVDGSRGVRVNAFSGTVGTVDTWLISKNKFDLTNLAAGTFSADIRSETGGNGTLEILYSTDYFRESPALATWEPVPNIADQLPVKGSNVFTTVSGDIPGGDYVYIAFRFSGASQDNSASYDIDNIALDPFEFGALPFNDAFEGCVEAGQFNIPENWREENVPGFNTNRGWGCRSEAGRTGWGVRASAFVGATASGADDSWLITAGAINLTEVTNVDISFWASTSFSGPGKLRVLWSSDYAGAGDPTQATWTEVTSLNTQLDALTATHTQLTADMSAAAGNSVYIAFRYYEGLANSSIAFNLDDFSLTGN